MGHGADNRKHWHEHTDAEGICWLTLDKADSRSNTLSSEVLAELGDVLDGIAARPGIVGLVVKSAKSTGFILGADVTEFGALEDASRAAALAERGQALMLRIERLPFPTVAAINGYALGGGLELALACDYRVAAESYERTLGLPEVQLGIHPGFGGTVRVIELLGPLKGLELMLSGRSMSPADASKAGLVDVVANESGLDEAAAALVRSKPPRKRAAWYLRLLNLAPLRLAIAPLLRAQVARRARREHYPAPYAIVDLWLRYGADGEAAYRAEAESIGRLLASQTCRNLVRIFMLRERLRNLAPKTDGVARVHVVGAGVMGGDIAAWCALRGLSVSLQDRALEYVEPALARAAKLFDKLLKTPGAPEAARERLTVDLEAVHVPKADVVIEAIIEDLDAKRNLFAEIERHADASAILASNTSSIRIEDIAGALEDPSRLVGLHFFNPVSRLPLVEVIRSGDTDARVVERSLSFVTQIGKLPLPCRSAPGFVVNRVLMPYMLEALRAHADGSALETIDAAARRFGMPMGPIALADQVGLDVALHVATNLSEAFGGEPPKSLRDKVESGDLGVKTGAGFYRYESGRAVKSRKFPAPDADLQDRLILSLVNEAVACFEDGVVEDLDLLDAGVIFGTGFAPHTGGPIQYARQRGFAEVERRLSELAERFGPRFEPHHGWKKLVAAA